MLSLLSPESPADALRHAVDAIGGQAALARLLGVSQPSVWKWLRSDKALPAEYVLTVEAETGIAKERLRPDIYPPEPAISADIEPSR